MYDLFEQIMVEYSKLISEIWKSKGFEIDENKIFRELEEPPIEKFGDLSLPVFKFAKMLRANPMNVAKETAEEISIRKPGFIRNVNIVGGYINVFLNEEFLAKQVFEALKNLGDKYGFVKVEKPERIVIEHTSANPVHPLHVGTARNAVLGDVLYRLLTRRGHSVIRRFYINDMGRQVAILAYGYMALNKPKPEGKPDHFFGIIYSITNAVIEIERLKKELERAKEEGDLEEYNRINTELLDWINVLVEQKNKKPEFVNKLIEKLKGKNHDEEIRKIMKDYETKSNGEVVKTIRTICEEILKGFEETLRNVGIEFDFWDWESDLVWSSLVGKILKEAKRKPCSTIYKGAFALDFSEIQKLKEVREKLNLPKTFKIPPLILQRSDGTTLYTTRDIAYSLIKFKNADRVINVIMSEQKLAQLQLKLALLALGYKKEAYNLVHYSYEIVNLPGMRMSGRKGRFVDFDTLIKEAISRAYYEVSKRNPQMSEDEKIKIAKAVGIGALRYALVSVSASKPLTFIWENVLSLEKNSGPYIQYTYARAKNILKNYGKEITFDPSNIDLKVLRKDKIRKLIILISKFPRTFKKTVDELKPEYLIDYAGKLADAFNSFYTVEPVLKEKDTKKKETKLYLVAATEIVFKNILTTLGIKAPERM